VNVTVVVDNTQMLLDEGEVVDMIELVSDDEDIIEDVVGGVEVSDEALALEDTVDSGVVEDTAEPLPYNCKKLAPPQFWNVLPVQLIAQLDCDMETAPSRTLSIQHSRPYSSPK
jgi:hypothetical protein